MSTTIAHPRSVPSGPSGRFAVGFVAVAIAVLGVGFGIVTSVEPVPVDASQSTARGADQLILQRAAELAAEQSTAQGADRLMLQKAAEYAAEYAAQAQNAQHEARIEYLTEQWITEHLGSKLNGAPRQPAVE